MYFIIEDSPTIKTVLGTYYTIEEAKDKKFDLENENDFCNYIITKVV